MKFLIRADASTQIGFGHVMRCCTLATSLAERNHTIKFLCEELPGNLINHIENLGFTVVHLKVQNSKNKNYDEHQLLSVIQGEKPDWMIIDHYQVDAKMESSYRDAGASKIMVIDDLANRSHNAELLLDQNLIENYSSRYQSFVPPGCITLLGPDYTLIRPEFLKYRQPSLERRTNSEMTNVLIFMGGGDVYKETTTAIEAVYSSNIQWSRLNVVLSESCSNQDDIVKLIQQKEYAALHIQTNYMAQLMFEADIAITGGGSVSWEKCLLGLPSLVYIMSADQEPLARALQKENAQINLDQKEKLSKNNCINLLENMNRDQLLSLSGSAAKICDGLGAKRVIDKLESIS